MDDLLPIESETKGEPHSDTFCTNGLRAKTLHHLGHYDEAFAALDWLQEVETEALRERHGETLFTRWLHAAVIA